jgi:hypothetical protein
MNSNEIKHLNTIYIYKSNGTQKNNNNKNIMSKLNNCLKNLFDFIIDINFLFTIEDLL